MRPHVNLVAVWPIIRVCSPVKRDAYPHLSVFCIGISRICRWRCVPYQPEVLRAGAVEAIFWQSPVRNAFGFMGGPRAVLQGSTCQADGAVILDEHSAMDLDETHTSINDTLVVLVQLFLDLCVEHLPRRSASAGAGWLVQYLK